MLFLFGYLITATLLWSAVGHAAPPVVSPEAPVQTSTETAVAPLDFAGALQALNADNFTAKEQAINALAALGDERTRVVLIAFQEGNLQYRKSDGKVVLVSEVAEGYQLTDPIEETDLGVVGKRDVKKITINNSLRRVLREAIARLSLTSERTDVRLTAVGELTGNLDAAAVALLERARTTEQDAEIIAAIDTALALSAVDSETPSVRLEAVAALQDSLLPAVRNRLSSVAESDANAEVKQAAARAVKSIETKLERYALAETVFFGLSLGSVLLLAAIGLAITFGVMGVINMAHGELIMIGAYTTYLVQQAMPQYLEYSMLVAVPAAFLAAGAFGIAIERGVIRFLYGRPLETLLATFGISLVLQQLVRTTISAQNVTVANPEWMSGSWQINAALSLTYNRLYIVIFTLLVFAALLLLLKKSALGLHVRAVAQNRSMARAMGIRTEWVDALTFGLGSGIAGVAGVALSQLTNVGPNMGQAYIIDSFMV
ncbi:MAG TPA: urea ABC transporter permease subunit UrtB, partial [Gammaproteobacteria bacterium]|nr:urea ABC transporter permease subunit UrtB [Gammaproteobacteria bacterium]